MHMYREVLRYGSLWNGSDSSNSDQVPGRWFDRYSASSTAAELDTATRATTS